MPPGCVVPTWCRSSASAGLFIVEVGSSAGSSDNHVAVGLRLWDRCMSEIMDGQEVRGWREVQIEEEEQYLYRETCLYQDPWKSLWGCHRENFWKSLWRTGFRGWPVGGEFVLPSKIPLSAPLPL